MKRRTLLCLVIALSGSLLFAQKKNSNLHTFLGVDVDGSSTQPNGLYVNGVYKGFGAEKAGIRRGDILQSINHNAVHNFGELVKTLDKYKAGQNVEVTILRNDQPQKINAIVSEYPDFLKYNSMKSLWEMEKNGDDWELRRATLDVDVEPVWEKYAVKVTAVNDNSGAEKAGIETGDIILKMDHYEFATIEELRYYLSKYKPGDVVALSVLHNGEERNVKVTLGEEVLHFNHKGDKDKEKEKSK